jgi:hypothetical protein
MFLAKVFVQEKVFSDKKVFCPELYLLLFCQKLFYSCKSFTLGERPSGGSGACRFFWLAALRRCGDL